MMFNCIPFFCALFLNIFSQVAVAQGSGFSFISPISWEMPTRLDVHHKLYGIVLPGFATNEDHFKHIIQGAEQHLKMIYIPINFGDPHAAVALQLLFILEALKQTFGPISIGFCYSAGCKFLAHLASLRPDLFAGDAKILFADPVFGFSPFAKANFFHSRREDLSPPGRIQIPSRVVSTGSGAHGERGPQYNCYDRRQGASVLLPQLLRPLGLTEIAGRHTDILNFPSKGSFSGNPLQIYHMFPSASDFFARALCGSPEPIRKKVFKIFTDIWANFLKV